MQTHMRVQVRVGCRTKIIASEETTDGSTVVLKAALSGRPSHPRALQWLFEALALFQGIPVHGVLVAGKRTDGYGSALFQEWFADFGGPLYTVDFATEGAPRRHRDCVGELTPRARQLVLFRTRRSR
jgi:hypothetical protein